MPRRGFNESAMASQNFKIHHRLKGGGFTQRLFAVPVGVVEILSVVHPFCILESSGVDPV